MYKTAVIGPQDSVMCFMATGADVAVADTAAAGEAALKRLAEDHAVIFITEELAKQLSAQIERYKDTPLPAIITVPGAAGARGYGMQSLRSACERAVGTDILSGKYQ